MQPVKEMSHHITGRFTTTYHDGEDLLLIPVIEFAGHFHYVPARHICKFLGLEWAGQRKRILRTRGVCKPLFLDVRSSDGKRRSMLCVRFDSVAYWLGSIREDRIRDSALNGIRRFLGCLDPVTRSVSPDVGLPSKGEENSQVDLRSEWVRRSPPGAAFQRVTKLIYEKQVLGRPCKNMAEVLLALNCRSVVTMKNHRQPQIWYPIKDICRIIRIAHHTAALQRVDGRHKVMLKVPSRRGEQVTGFVSMEGVRQLLDRGNNRHIQTLRKLSTDGKLDSRTMKMLLDRSLLMK